ncbi:hypothetical protein K2X85_12610 [bacterium]|nr:hypothetical protein [bacterium]
MTWREYQTRSSLLDASLEETVLGQLQGRLLDFSVEQEDGELVLRGLTHSYHVKQLAQCAVMNLTDQPIRENCISVEPSRHRGYVSPR